MASVDQKDERYFQIEREGRFISSVVALVAAALTWMHTQGTLYAVALLIGSMSFDLWRCAYRKHMLEPPIIVHHLATIVIGTVFLCLQTEDPLVANGTTDLVRMELCNPSLHLMWYLAKDRSSLVLQGRHLQMTLSVLATMVLWPQYRIGRPALFAIRLVHGMVTDHKTSWLAIGLVLSLVYLQVLWFGKIVRNILDQSKSKQRWTPKNL